MTLQRWIGALLLLIALAVGGALRAVSPAEISDLRPRPDALEYEEGARNLAAGEGYVLIIDGAKYAPRYPPGFSLLLAPVLRVWDAGFGSGVVVVLALALLTILGAFVLAALAAGPIAGGVAALLVALSPEHVRWSQAVMSDVPSAWAVTWVLVGASLVARTGRAVHWGALGVTIGLIALLRLTNLAVAAPVAVCALLAASRMRAVTALCAGVAAGLLPLLAYQSSRFGSPLGTGYALWAPDVFFGVRYLGGPPAAGGTEPNAVVYGESLLGFGKLYPWPIALLVAMALVVAFRAGGRRRELALLATCTTAAFFLGHVAYYWQDPRFLLPALPVLLAAAATAFSAEASRGLQAAGALALTVLAVVSLAGTGEVYVPDGRFGEPEVLAKIAEHVPPDAAILVRTNETYFRRVLRKPGSDHIWVPLGADPHELAILLHRIRPEEEGPRPDWIRRELRPRTAVKVVSQLLESGRPVYLSSLLAFQVATFGQVLSDLNARFRFEPVASTGGDTELFRLLPRDRTPRVGFR